MNRLSLALIASLLLLSVFSQAQTFTPLTYLGQVLGSGDDLLTDLPAPSSPTALAGLRVLFGFSHGVEDQEVYYFYNYLIDRGVTDIVLGIDYDSLIGQDVVISDFYKPSYLIPNSETKDLYSEDFESYDVIFFPGGFPSSSLLKTNSRLIEKLRAFYLNPLNASKLVAFICSGTEIALTSGLLDEFLGQPITGSPAAVVTFQTYLKSHDIDVSTFTNLPSVALKSPTNSRPQIILGREPNASFDFVLMVSNEYFGLNESASHSVHLKTVPTYPKGKIYIEGLFELLEDSDLLFLLPHQLSSASYSLLQTRLLRSSSSKSALVAISSGVSQKDLEKILSQIPLGTHVKIICPSWVIDYKGAQIFTFSKIPTQPQDLIHCDLSFDQVLESNMHFSSLYVPSGLFSTNAVLRNDSSFIQLLNNTIENNNKKVILSQTAISLLLPLKLSYPNLKILSLINLVPYCRLVSTDLATAGFITEEDTSYMVYNNLVLLGENY